MRAMTVKNARESLKAVGVSGFAAEMGISVVDAKHVANYVELPDVSEEGLVLLAEATVDGVTIGAGNRRLYTA